MNNVIVRSILFWISLIGLVLIAATTIMPFFPIRNKDFTNGIIGSIIAFFCVWVFLKWDKSNFRQIGLNWDKKTLFRFFLGLFIGTIIMGLLCIGLIGFSELQISRNPKGVTSAVAIGYLVFIPLALMEELAFRSYPFVLINRKYGMWTAQLVTATAFALYHILIGWSVFSAFTGPFVMAFTFGLAAAWSGGIALPTGLHAALNVLQVFFGMKGDEHSFFNLSYKEGLAQNLIDKTDTVGLILQFLVLITGVIATAWYVRNKRNEQVIAGSAILSEIP